MARSNPVNPSAYPISTEFVTVDSTPVSSPASATGGSAVEILIPDYAAEIFIIANQDVYVYEDSDSPVGRYLLKSNTEMVRGVGNTEKLKVLQSGTPCDVWFMFALIK